MSEGVRAAVLISAAGMGLVFGVILLLWGLMALVVRIAAERQTGDAKSPIGQEAEEDAARRRRAAAAVAAVSAAIEHERAGDSAQARAAAAAVGAYLAGERRTPRK
jgi:Na+-transporting methylmalonyl-CoA/oxaloacetate decarboxylase gamma subunit